MLKQAQQACRFEHRDMKADNLMLTLSEPQERGIINGNASYPLFGRKLLFIDFGMTRFELDGEYLGCDCMHTDVTFNPCHDLQSLACTLLEDYFQEFRQNAPVFLQYLQRMTLPLFQGVRKQYSNYDTMKSSSRHKRLCMFVAKERNSAFTPVKVLEDMSMYWAQKKI
jgi:hypothetical protein